MKITNLKYCMVMLHKTQKYQSSPPQKKLSTTLAEIKIVSKMFKSTKSTYKVLRLCCVKLKNIKVPKKYTLSTLAETKIVSKMYKSTRSIY